MKAKPSSKADKPVLVIPADAVFRLDSLTQLLGLPPTALKRAAREGHLRVSRRCGWYWTTGRWVHEWLERGERKRRLRPAAESA